MWLQDTYGINNLELYCIFLITLAASLLYDHTLNCLLSDKQPSPDQTRLLLKIRSAHVLHNSFGHQKASFKQISKKFPYCNAKYQNEPTGEKKRTSLSQQGL